MALSVVSTNVTSLLKAHGHLFLVFTKETGCLACDHHKAEYQAYAALTKADDSLPRLAAVDAQQQAKLMRDYAVHALPQLVLASPTRHTLYTGKHTARAMALYGRASLRPACASLGGADRLVDLFSTRRADGEDAGLLLLGLFNSLESEEDEVDDLCDGAEELRRARPDAAVRSVFAQLTPELRTRYAPWCRRPPCALLFEGGTSTPLGDSAFALAEAHETSLRDWAVATALPAVAELTELNFAAYAATNLPMLIAFVKGRKGSRGKLSGGFRSVMERVAARFRSEIVVVWADAKAHAARMTLLGLSSKHKELPSVAFNTNDGRRAALGGPIPSARGDAEASIARFVQDFLAGRLGMQPPSIVPPTAQPLPPPPPPGFPERPRPSGMIGSGAVVELEPGTFEQRAMGPRVDVLLQLYSSSGCEACERFEKYYGKVALRFSELGYPDVAVARYDVARYALPESIQSVSIAQLPAVIVLPARRKEPPWEYFRGSSRPSELMYFLARHATNRITLPPNPHLNREEHAMWKEQVEQLPADRRDEEWRRVERETGLTKDEV